MATHFYILAEYKNQGFVISKFKEEKEAKANLVSLDSKLMFPGTTEVEALGEVRYLETYFIIDDTKIINMREMIFSEGSEVNTYLIKRETEIADFSELPRINENELFKEEDNACDFPF